MYKQIGVRSHNSGVAGHAQALARFFAILLALIVLFAVIFKILMAFEGRDYSWATAFYWTLTTMSTLGYGDIVFQNDLGRMFSMVVLLSGILFMLVLFPSVFIRFVYEPWVEGRALTRIPRDVPESVQGHVILTFFGPVASALINRLTQFNYPYVVILPDETEVLELKERGIRAMFGAYDDPETFQKARVEHAAMVATTRSDIENTTIVFTVRGISKSIPVFATARESSAEDVLNLAGCTRVISLTHLVSDMLARHAKGGRGLSQVVGRIDDLVIAEVDAARTNLIGETLDAAQAATAISIVGVWHRGIFTTGNEDILLTEDSTLVMAGSVEQLKEFNAHYGAEDNEEEKDERVLIVGGGRVGRGTAEALRKRGFQSRIVELLPERIPSTIDEGMEYVAGSAAERATMLEAGIETAQTIIITTRDDELNVFITMFARLLRPDIQIISRATGEGKIAALHRAGSDIVVSYASMGANALFNLLERSDLLMVAEGLDVFKLPVPTSLVGVTIAQADIRNKTGCSVIGIDDGEHTVTNPDPDTELPQDGEIVLIGDVEGEASFLAEFVSSD